MTTFPALVEAANHAPIWMWADPSQVEEQAMDQLRNVAALPYVHHHVAVMPDVHYGKGATVGSVIALRGAVAPAAVGVDIGCGMAAVQTNLKASDLPDDLGPIRSGIEAAIPVGFNRHGEQAREAQSKKSEALLSRFHFLPESLRGELKTAVNQIGTLGGGNHFIELCLDTEDNVWLMLHSGSRGIGNKIATEYISRAMKMEHNVGLPDKDLSVFLAGSPEMDMYVRDLKWAQEYAFLNREVMLAIYQRVLRRHLPGINFKTPVNCHHNYLSEETHYDERVLVTRKGAISAKRDEWGIIPGSMGTRSFIVQGLGNPASFQSASHGAGRRMSRGKAKKTFTLEDLAEQTKGIECRKDAGVLDEIPGAYKDIGDVIEAQSDLVAVRHELHQVLCVKG